MVSPTPNVAVVVAPIAIGLGDHERFGLIGSACTASSAGDASRSRAAKARSRALAFGMFRCMYFIKTGHPKSAYKPCEPEIHAHEFRIHVTFFVLNMQRGTRSRLLLQNWTGSSSCCEFRGGMYRVRYQIFE